MTDGVAQFPFPSLNAMIQEADRELSMRQEVYPRLVAAGKLKAPVAARRIQLLEGIRDALVEIEADDDLRGRIRDALIKSGAIQQPT